MSNSKFSFGKLISNILLVFKIDIYDLNFQISNEKIGYLYLPYIKTPRRKYLFRIDAFFRNMLFSFFYELSCCKKTFQNKVLSKKDILFFVVSFNQKESLKEICSNFNNAYFSGERLDVDIEFPLFFAHIASLPFIPILIIEFLKSVGYKRKTFYQVSEQYLLSYGYYIVANIWVYVLKPKLIVLSNDHIMKTRVITTVAQGFRIPVIYLQHATVTEKFPPLFFDYALLEGEDSLNKYKKNEAYNTKIYLIGMPKLDISYKYINENKKTNTVGICTNMLDSINDIEDLCVLLNKEIPTIHIIIRPHPGDTSRENAWRLLVENYSFSYSTVTIENSFDFLKKVDVIIAGNSSILLEATLLNVYPLMLKSNTEVKDVYGFVKNGLVECEMTNTTIIKKLKELQYLKPYVRHRACYYCSTIDTEYDGNSSQLASDYINSILSGDMEKYNYLLK